jgi:hypothetical protein
MLGVLLLYAKDRYQLFLDAPVVEHLLTTWTFDAVSDSYRVQGFLSFAIQPQPSLNFMVHTQIADA